MDLFKEAGPDAQHIADRFLAILRATSQDPVHALPHIIPEQDYRNTFLKLTRNLAPTGKNAQEIELRGAGEIRGVVLGADNRKELNAMLRPRPDPVTGADEVRDQLRGVLRAVHLDADWLEVVVDNEPVRVDGLSATVDDVIGPMVNRPVIVHVIKRDPRGLDAWMRPRQKRFRFVDIETQE